DLIHPGYGFLAESPAFASAVDAAGLRFVGPSAKVMSALGDKANAKDIARRAGVPTLPGHASEDQRDETFIAAAKRIGYPVIVKPIAGGGGIGMQRVRDESSLRDALAKARRIAAASFGDERLMLERLVEHPRHVRSPSSCGASILSSSSCASRRATGSRSANPRREATPSRCGSTRRTSTRASFRRRASFSISACPMGSASTRATTRDARSRATTTR